MNNLEAEVKTANDLANKIRAVVKKEWFTIHDLVNCSNVGHEQAKGSLNHLALYGFIKTISEDNKYKHKILSNQVEREEIIQNGIENLEEDIKSLKEKKDYLINLKKVKISSLIKA